MSVWMFNCALGLAQDDCAAYTNDPESRGAGRWQGCASCQCRVPYNAETEKAESAYKRAYARPGNRKE